MNEIAEKLRAEHQAARERGGDYLDYGPGFPWAVQAADLIDRLERELAEAKVYKGKYEAVYRVYRNLLRIVKPIRNTLTGIRDDLADEGDRVYFGSSNHADQFKELTDDLDAAIFEESAWPVHKATDDLCSEIASLRVENAAVRAREAKAWNAAIEAAANLHSTTLIRDTIEYEYKIRALKRHPDGEG